MSKKRYVNDCIREDPYIMDLDPSEKLLFVYFLTNNKVSLCGIYEIHIRKIALETGFDKDMILKVLGRFEKDDKMYYRDGILFICNFLKNQSLNDNMKKGVERELKELGDEKIVLFSGLKGFERLGKALKSFGILNLTLLNLTLPNSTLPNGENETSKNISSQEEIRDIYRPVLDREEYEAMTNQLNVVRQFVQTGYKVPNSKKGIDTLLGKIQKIAESYGVVTPMGHCDWQVVRQTVLKMISWYEGKGKPIGNHLNALHTFLRPKK